MSAFGGKADMGSNIAGCPLLTQSGHLDAATGPIVRLVIIHVSVLHEPLCALLPRNYWGTFGQSKRYPPAGTPPE